MSEGQGLTLRRKLNEMILWSGKGCKWEEPLTGPASTDQPLVAALHREQWERKPEGREKRSPTKLATCEQAVPLVRPKAVLGCQEIQPVRPKGNQPWVFTGRTDAEAEAPVLWHLMPRANSLEKTLMLGKVEGRREKGMTEDEMFGWHHRLQGHEFEQVPGVGDGQGGLTCCDSWGHRVRRDWVTKQQQWKLFEEQNQLPICSLAKRSGRKTFYKEASHVLMRHCRVANSGVGRKLLGGNSPNRSQLHLK